MLNNKLLKYGQYEAHLRRGRQSAWHNRDKFQSTAVTMERLYPTGPIENLLKQMTGLERFKEKKKERFEELTEREVEVLSLIAGGLKNPAIAGKLDISRTTVQNHRASIREKLNIENQVGYVKYALAYDLIQL